MLRSGTLHPVSYAAGDPDAVCSLWQRAGDQGRAGPPGTPTIKLSHMCGRRLTTRSRSAFSGYRFPDEVIASRVRW